MHHYLQHLINRVSVPGANSRTNAGSGLFMRSELHAVSPYGRWCWRSELCVSRQEEMKPNEPTVLSQAVWRFVLKEDARPGPARIGSGPAAPGCPPLSLNRLKASQVRAGTLQWKMKLEETAGLLG